MGRTPPAEEPETGKPSGSAALPLGRHPRDLAALIAAIVVFVLCSLVARAATVNPVEAAIYQQLARIPPASRAVWQVLDWAGGWAGVVAVAAVAFYAKRIRVGLSCAAAGAVGWALARVADPLTGGRHVSPGVLGPGAGPLPAGIDPFPAPQAVMAAAVVAVAAPYLKTGYRRAGWALVVLVAVAGVHLGHNLPVDVFAGVFLGWGVGAAFHLAWGAPGRRTSAMAVFQALGQAGLEPVTVTPVRAHWRGPLQFVVTTAASAGTLRVEAVRRLRRRAGLWYRLRRLLASLEVEDEPPLSSTYHEAEHEALVTMLAERGGVPTPPVLLACRAPDGSALLVRRQIEGHRLTRLAPAEISESLLEALWGHIASLGDARIAHHDLRAKNVLVDVEGKPWLLNLTLSKAGATKARTDQDTAEALVSIASLVGVERAVLSAAKALPPDRLESALTYLQPLALPRRIRKQLRNQRVMLADLRESLADRIDRPLPIFRSPVRPSRVLGLLLIGAAVYTLLPQLATLPGVLDLLGQADWWWLAATVGTGLLAIALSAVSIRGASAAPLPFWYTTAAQFAAAFTGRTTPGGVGFFGINVAFMERLGIRRAQAVGVAMLNVAATGVIGGVWSVAGAFGLGSAGLVTNVSMPGGWPVFAAAGGVLAVGAAVLGSPWGRRRVVWPALRVMRDLAATMRQPRRALQLWGGAAAYLAVSGLGLVTSLAAFQPEVPVFAVITAFVIGHTFGHIVPTPGGLGAVESLTVGSLVALGIAPAGAVAAVLVSRVLTYWLPVLPGVAVFRYLQHRRIV
ncbi:flippase-like domain-containing protein [Amycolatopsis alkalitolerans]|uniref:Flippase-like domain-containing protein n=1 Tax=Amycolatopsis alkalitolerans TaxID=2547244 RepID=A0A5C4LUA0_9PSEU|nr:flippase-like domain-containing protein [Amycolatopsis alkalitolerans]TNC20982.1 flippase-like domain-containing protein [Amycolatopsis alkalitolerans]